MPENQCIKLPPNLPFEEAASMALVYDTAYFALKDRGRIAPGETVLVLGATGGVGLAAIQLAKAFGGKVFAAGFEQEQGRHRPRRRGRCHHRPVGAWICTRACASRVFALTGKKGVDIIVDMLGGDIFDAAVRALAWCGRLIVIGFASGRIPSLKMNYVLVKNIEVSGMQVSDHRKRKPQDMQARLRRHLPAARRGQVEAAADQGLSARAVRRGAPRHQGPQSPRADSPENALIVGRDCEKFSRQFAGNF